MTMAKEVLSKRWAWESRFVISIDCNSSLPVPMTFLSCCINIYIYIIVFKVILYMCLGMEGDLTSQQLNALIMNQHDCQGKTKAKRN